MKFNKLYILLSLFLFFTPAKSETEYTFYSGTFDTIDKEKDDQAGSDAGVVDTKE